MPDFFFLSLSLAADIVDTNKKDKEITFRLKNNNFQLFYFPLDNNVDDARGINRMKDGNILELIFSWKQIRARRCFVVAETKLLWRRKKFSCLDKQQQQNNNDERALSFAKKFTRSSLNISLCVMEKFMNISCLNIVIYIKVSTFYF